LAAGLWASGRYEARMLATLVDDPALVTKAQMDAWAADFDTWAICDTACFKLFDRTPHAYGRAAAWAKSPREYVRRGGFALMACLAGHDRDAPDATFLAFLPEIARGAADPRDMVAKGVSWALRRIGGRSAALHAACVALATELAARDEGSCRFVGKDALRDLGSAPTRKRLERAEARRAAGAKKTKTAAPTKARRAPASAGKTRARDARGPRA